MQPSDRSCPSSHSSSNPSLDPCSLGRTSSLFFSQCQSLHPCQEILASNFLHDFRAVISPSLGYIFSSSLKNKKEPLPWLDSAPSKSIILVVPLYFFFFFINCFLEVFIFFAFQLNCLHSHCPLIHFLHLSTCSTLTTLPNVLAQRLFLRYAFWMQGLQVFIFLIFLQALTRSPALPLYLELWCPASTLARFSQQVASVCVSSASSEPHPRPRPLSPSFFLSSFSPWILSSSATLSVSAVWTVSNLPKARARHCLRGVLCQPIDVSVTLGSFTLLLYLCVVC